MIEKFSQSSLPDFHLHFLFVCIHRISAEREVSISTCMQNFARCGRDSKEEGQKSAHMCTGVKARNEYSFTVKAHINTPGKNSPRFFFLYLLFCFTRIYFALFSWQETKREENNSPQLELSRQNSARTRAESLTFSIWNESMWIGEMEMFSYFSPSLFVAREHLKQSKSKRRKAFHVSFDEMCVKGTEAHGGEKRSQTLCVRSHE